MNETNPAKTPTVDRIDKVLQVLILGVPGVIIGVLILVGIAINFANVVGRYVFLAPVIWAEEIMIYIMVWTVFLGAVLPTWDGRHLKMDYFTIKLPSPWKEVLGLSGVIAFILVIIFVLPQNFIVVEMMQRLDQRSVVAEIKMVIPHFAILFGFSLMLVAVIWRFKKLVTGDLEGEVEDIVHEYGGDEEQEGQS